MKLRIATAALVLALSALLGPQAASGARAQAAPTDEFRWQTLGEKTYDTYCSACHQRDGHGVTGGFPPLAGHAPEILARPDGRAYIARVVLFGLTGAIKVG